MVNGENHSIAFTALGKVGFSLRLGRVYRIITRCRTKHCLVVSIIGWRKNCWLLCCFFRRTYRRFQIRVVHRRGFWLNVSPPLLFIGNILLALYNISRLLVGALWWSSLIDERHVDMRLCVAAFWRNTLDDCCWLHRNSWPDIDCVAVVNIDINREQFIETIDVMLMQRYSSLGAFFDIW